MCNLTERYSNKCKICRVLCPVERVEFSPEEIERINQTHEKEIKKSKFW